MLSCVDKVLRVKAYSVGSQSLSVIVIVKKKKSASSSACPLFNKSSPFQYRVVMLKVQFYCYSIIFSDNFRP